jgi:hypothetical protein
MGHDHDPLGPPVERPPIDMSQLDAAFGPPPERPAAAPAAGPALGPATQAAASAPPLPRRTPGASAPTGAPSMRAGGHAGGAHDDWPAGADPEPWPEPGHPGARAATFAPPSPGVPSPRGTSRTSAAGGVYTPPATSPTPPRPAGKPGASDGGAGAKPAPMTPAALPVIVLVVLVIVLVAGVAWLVIAGDDAGTPASDGVGTPATAPVPSAVTATDTPDGVQVTWHGEAEASYVVTVLTTTEPPRALPPAQGTSLLVPKAGATAPPQCFTVAAAAPQPDQDPGPASDVACIAGVSPDAMIQE